MSVAHLATVSGCFGMYTLIWKEVGVSVLLFHLLDGIGKSEVFIDCSVLDKVR